MTTLVINCSNIEELRDADSEWKCKAVEFLVSGGAKYVYTLPDNYEFTVERTPVFYKFQVELIEPFERHAMSQEEALKYICKKFNGVSLKKEGKNVIFY